MEYQMCSRCIMDNKSEPLIIFDEEGVCNHCHDFDKRVAALPGTEEERKKVFDSLVAEMKEHGKGKEFDCVLGISGGVDSAYLAYVAKKAGLRILAVHVDAGWNTDVAVENIKKLCKALEIELHTIVVDWATVRELQRAYMFSGLPNLDVVQDHAFLAGTFKFARKFGVNYMLNGSNYQTEGILPSNYGYAAIDLRNIKDVYRKCGRGRISLRKYPQMSLFTYSLMYMGKTKRVNLLNYVPYSKKMAIEFLHKEFDWNYYGGKHFESRFTKFFQSYYLPKKFGYEKKRAHISSLIVGGEITREEGLREMADDSAYTEEQMLEDRDYILKKLDMTLEDWNMLMAAPARPEDDYGNGKAMMRGWNRVSSKKSKDGRNANIFNENNNKKLLVKICINEWKNENRDKKELCVCRELGAEVRVLAKGAGPGGGRSSFKAVSLLQLREIKDIIKNTFWRDERRCYETNRELCQGFS